MVTTETNRLTWFLADTESSGSQTESEPDHKAWKTKHISAWTVRDSINFINSTGYGKFVKNFRQQVKTDNLKGQSLWRHCACTKPRANITVATTIPFLLTSLLLWLLQEVDGKALVLLSLDQIHKCLGLTLGPAVKLHDEIQRLRNEPA